MRAKEIFDLAHYTISKNRSNIYDVCDYSLYDRCWTRKGNYTKEEYQFYSIPQGVGACQACSHIFNEKYCNNCGSGGSEYCQKTIADTNMVMANLLPQPQMFSISSCIYFLINNQDILLDDIDQLMNNYCWQLVLGQKHYDMGPLARFPNICNFDMIKLIKVDDNLQLTLKREDDVVIVRKVEIPLIIEQGQYFKMSLRGTPFKVSSDISIMSVMEGKIARGVQ